MTDTFTINLPIPPSVNHLYRRKRGGKQVQWSKAYKQWRHDAHYLAIGQVNQQRAFQVPTTQAVAVSIRINIPRHWDIDNYKKAVHDLLEGMVYANDNQIEFSTVQRDNRIPAKHCRVTVTIINESMRKTLAAQENIKSFWF